MPESWSRDLIETQHFALKCKHSHEKPDNCKSILRLYGDCDCTKHNLYCLWQCKCSQVVFTGRKLDNVVTLAIRIQKQLDNIRYDALYFFLFFGMFDWRWSQWSRWDKKTRTQLQHLQHFQRTRSEKSLTWIRLVTTLSVILLSMYLSMYFPTKFKVYFRLRCGNGIYAKGKVEQNKTKMWDQFNCFLATIHNIVIATLSVILCFSVKLFIHEDPTYISNRNFCLCLQIRKHTIQVPCFLYSLWLLYLIAL